MSMGGYLAPRAAAFDDRFDGVVAYDVMFDMGDIGRRNVPDFVYRLYDSRWRKLALLLPRIKAGLSPGFRWLADNSMWTLGARDPLEAGKIFRDYSLRDVASRIKGDVLILAGAEDHFVPIEQVDEFEQALTGARSVTTRIYDRQSGGAEHCQLGAHTLWHCDFFDWMMAKFQ